MENCIFCKIIAGEIPGDIVYRDNEVLAFRDIHPVAPTHLLIIPIQHFVTLNDFPENDFSLAAKMLLTARKLAEQERIDDGYRLVINSGDKGGQIIKHLHLHLIGGRQLSEKLG